MFHQYINLVEKINKMQNTLTRFENLVTNTNYKHETNNINEGNFTRQTNRITEVRKGIH